MAKTRCLSIEGEKNSLPASSTGRETRKEYLYGASARRYGELDQLCFARLNNFRAADREQGKRKNIGRNNRLHCGTDLQSG